MDTRNQLLDCNQCFRAAFAAYNRQAVRRLGFPGVTQHGLGHFLNGSGHLSNRRSGLVGFDALTANSVRALAYESMGSTSLLIETFCLVIYAGESCAYPGIFTDQQQRKL